jgi:hypothetical protein
LDYRSRSALMRAAIAFARVAQAKRAAPLPWSEAMREGLREAWMHARHARLRAAA